MEKSQKMSFLQVVKRFFEPILAEPKMYIKSIVPYTLFATLPIIIVIVLQYITFAVEKGDKELFDLYLLIFLAISILYQVLARLTRKWGWVEIRTKGFKKIYPSYLKKFIVLDNTSVERIGTGRMISIIEKGFDTWIMLIETLFMQGIEMLLFLLFIGYSISKMGRGYCLLFLGVVALIQFVIYYMSKYVKASKYEEAGIVSERSRSMIKIIMSKFEIQQQGRGNEEIKKIDKNTDDLHKNILGRLPFVHAIFFFPELMGTVVALVVFWIVGNGVFDGTFSFSTLVLFAGTLTLMDGVIDKLSRFIKNFMRDFGTIEKLWDTFDTIKVMDKYDKGSDFNYKSGNISLQNVSFSYDKSFVFQNFNLEIQGGTKTAFVGESGGGKTTLIKLLAGYIRPDNGEIEIDGQKLSEIKLTDYYKHIGYLTQDPSVFDGTIYENLVYALDTEPPQEDLERVVKLAKCEFIREFEKGLETEIGERGVRLSGGQKQRLAIAKIMLKNPNIILLDEPTSALDSFNEEQISIALHNLFKGKTVIVVAHRLQTVKQADRILLFEQGKILEEGTHDELVKLGGKYKKMLDLQSGF